MGAVLDHFCLDDVTARRPVARWLAGPSGGRIREADIQGDPERSRLRSVQDPIGAGSKRDDVLQHQAEGLLEPHRAQEHAEGRDGGLADEQSGLYHGDRAADVGVRLRDADERGAPPLRAGRPGRAPDDKQERPLHPVQIARPSGGSPRRCAQPD